MKTIKKILNSKAILVFIAIAFIFSCTKEDDGPLIYTTTPGIALLSLPLNNQECEVGEIIDNNAAITLSWEASADTEKYDIKIVNLVTEEVTLNVGIPTNTTLVRLERGYPYSWVVSSRNSGDISTDSEVWKFYVAGDGESNNVPFPASLISPYSGATVKPIDGKISLEWESESTDSDGDEVSYTVFIDTVDGNQATSEELKNLKETTIDVSVDENTIYFWHVEVSDGVNSSISSTYTFRTGDTDSVIAEGIIVSTSQEILTAIAAAAPGEIIYVKGGDYIFDSTISIGNSGSSTDMISLIANPDDNIRPRFNFSSMSENSSNRGIQLDGSYWYIKGIDVYGAGDNGMFVKGNNNLIEFSTFSENSDTGLQIGNGASNNTILNCDSYFNADSTLENADGFACKLDAGTGNKFIGCRAWQNLDDGWDGYLRGTDDITTTYENCWAFKNGISKNGTVGVGDGNGFKTGGSDDKTLKHNAVYKNCIAVANTHDGFDHNSNRGNVTIYNCSAYSNGRNISFGSGNIANSLILKNTASLAGGSSDSFEATTTDITNNSWQNGISIASDDFVSLDIDLLSSSRNTDGSLPNVDFMKLAAGSDLIDAGVNVGIEFTGSAPDLGAFEN